jgi:NADH-quinone oxidoreductase subunit N
MSVTRADILPLGLDLALCAGILLLFVVDLLLGKRSSRATGYIAAITLVGILFASFRIDVSGSSFGGVYVGDAWTLFFKRTFLAAGFLTVLGSLDHVATRQAHRQGEYYLLILFSVLGMTLLPGTRDLVLLIVCFELMSLPLFVLAAWAKNDDKSGPEQHAPEASLKLYLVSAVSAAITLFGLSIVYGMTGVTRIEGIAHAPTTPLLMVGVLLVLAGMAFKIGVVPFHMWVPDTYQGSSTPFVAFLSVAPKLAGFAAIATLFLHGFGQSLAGWKPVLVAFSLISMLVGNVLAVVQTNAKRMLAYSGIGHIGYMLMAFVAGQQGASMLLFYAVAYVVTNIGAFQVVEAVEQHTGDSSLKAFDGLAQRSPALAMSMLLFLLSLAGIPFVVGFWAKLYVFVAAWQSGLFVLVIAGAILAVVGLFYYMQIARAMYMKPPPESTPVHTPSALQISLTLCIAGVVLFGLWPGPLLDRAFGASQPFFTARGILEAPDAAKLIFRPH